LLRLLQTNPTMNQRELAKALGVSSGKANFCLKALVDKGLLKMQNFKFSKKKSSQTPHELLHSWHRLRSVYLIDDRFQIRSNCQLRKINVSRC
jgi:DNA-binding Lrp family transcriptional regulator